MILLLINSKKYHISFSLLFSADERGYIPFETGSGLINIFSTIFNEAYFFPIKVSGSYSSIIYPF